MKLMLVIIHYNENEYLDKLFSTIAASSLIPDKIIFVDNYSPIDPINIIEKYKSILNIKYIRNEKNLFFTKGTNVGIREALKSGADVIGTMNSDMYVQQNTFEEIMKYIKTPNVVAVTPNIRNLSDTKDCFTPLKAEGIFGNAVAINTKDIITKTNFIIGASLFVKRDVLEKTGLFYEPYIHGTEDFELADKIKKYGDMLYIKSTNIYHRDNTERSGSPSRKTDFFEKLNSKNWYIYCLRNKKSNLILVKLALFKNLFGAIKGDNTEKQRLLGKLEGIKETWFHLTNKNKYL